MTDASPRPGGAESPGSDGPDGLVATAAVELVRVRLPLRRELASAHGTESVREVVLVRVIADDGVEGWGECSALEAPTYTGEYTDGAWAVLRDHLVPPLLAGRGGVRVRGHPMACAALADAALDVHLRRRGVALAASLGAGEEHGLTWTGVVGLVRHGSVEAQAVAAAGAAVDAGASALKLKIRPAGRPAALAAVTTAFPGVPLAADANGSFRGDEQELVELAEVLAGTPAGPHGTARYLEQPLPADDLVGHAELARRLAVPIALDESIEAPGDIVTASRLGACELVNLKPARVGGVQAALRILPRGPGGPAAFLGGMLETGVGRAAALAVGAALELPATDLGPSSWYFDEDVTEPIELGSDGLMRPPSGSGIGVVPRPDRLAAVAVDRLLLRP